MGSRRRNDVIEGQDGTDTMLFNGSNVGENIDISANGQRIRLVRNVANITMDTDDVEAIEVNAVGGPDNIVVNDISGTDLTSIGTNLAASGGVGDQSADNVIVNATQGDDVVVLNGRNGNTEISGLQARISVSGAEPSNDRVTVNTLAGDDVVDASGVDVSSARLTLSGGDGNDVMIDGGDGDDVEINFAAAEPVSKASSGRTWLAGHASTVDGKTVLDLGSRTVTLPRAQLSQL